MSVETAIVTPVIFNRENLYKDSVKHVLGNWNPQRARWGNTETVTAQSSHHPQGQRDKGRKWGAGGY